jgi:hypothetical protein
MAPECIAAREATEARLDEVCGSWPDFVEPNIPDWRELCKFTKDTDLVDYYDNRDLQFAFIDSRTTTFQVFILNNGFLNDPDVLKFHKSALRDQLKRKYSEARVDTWPECATDILKNRSFLHLAHFDDFRNQFLKSETRAFLEFLAGYLRKLPSCPSPKLHTSLFARYRDQELRRHNEHRDHARRIIKCARYYMRYQFPLGYGLTIRDIAYLDESQMGDYP